MTFYSKKWQIGYNLYVKAKRFFNVTVQNFLHFRDLMFDKKNSLDEGRVEE